MVMNDMTDDGKWGAAIPIVDGKRPEWLGDDDVCALVLDGNLLDGDGKMTAANWVWGGTHQFIRLPVDHPHYQQTQALTMTAQERLEKYEGFVKKLAAIDATDTGPHFADNWCHDARALVAEMEPVVDGDLVEAREIMAARYPDTAHLIRAGNWDLNAVADCLEGIKRGRELARGEGA